MTTEEFVAKILEGERPHVEKAGNLLNLLVLSHKRLIFFSAETFRMTPVGAVRALPHWQAYTYPVTIDTDEYNIASPKVVLALNRNLQTPYYLNSRDRTITFYEQTNGTLQLVLMGGDLDIFTTQA